MKSLKLETIGMLFIAILLSANTNVFAQKGYGSGYGQGNGQFNENDRGAFCNNIPNLTADQQTDIDKLKTAHWKEMQNGRNQMAEKRARLQTLRSADNADMNTINKTIDEMSVIRTGMQKNREQHFQDVRNVLTDDQRVYFDNFNRAKGQGQGYGRGYGGEKGRGYGRCGRNW